MLFHRIISSVLLFISLTFSQRVTIMSYNVDNLFDDVSNGTEYKRYNPANGSWDREKYLAKLRNIARVIIDSSRRAPDIVALQEVENRNALETLNSMYLNKLGYRYVAIVPKEGIATNVAVLSRYPIKSVHSYYVGNWDDRPLRDILEVDIDIGGLTLYLFNNHWKSKNGGVRKTEIARLRAASVLLERVRAIYNKNPHADIVVVGDLNEDFDEYVRIRGRYQTALIPLEGKWFEGENLVRREALRRYLENESSLFLIGKIPESGNFSNVSTVFYEPWFEYLKREGNYNFGSYVYRGRWETPDHILLFPTLFDGMGLEYRGGNFHVIKASFMLTGRGYPARWYCRGSKCRGYSDHLPVIVTIYRR